MMESSSLCRKTSVLIAICGWALSAQAKYDGGSGEPNNPYQISSAADWQELMATPADWASHFILTSDIELDGVSITPIAPDTSASYEFQGVPFTGIFDGNDYVIRNVDVNTPGRDYVGLFGYLGTDGQIKNLRVEDTSILGRDYVGGLAARSHGTVTNCYSSGLVTGDFRLGGLVGWHYGLIGNSFWDVNTSGSATSDGGTPKTTVEMKTMSTFTDAGWDFVGATVNGPNDIWAICEGTNYPRLVYQIPMGDIICPDGVNSFDFALLSQYWRETDCPAIDDCEGADIDLSGAVDFGDVQAVAESWLRGVE